jgi:hypothetical protein
MRKPAKRFLRTRRYLARTRRHLDDEERADPWPGDGADGIDVGGGSERNESGN